MIESGKESEVWFEGTFMRLQAIGVMGTFLLSFPLWSFYCYMASLAGFPDVTFGVSVGATFFLRYALLPAVCGFRPFGSGR